MIKRSLSNGVKVLKISTWISAIFALLVVLVIGFFVVFPGLLKAPIESGLTDVVGLDVKISKITFGLDKSGISLNIRDLKLNNPETSQALASIQGLYWRVQLFNLFKDVYSPNHIFIDAITLHDNHQAKNTAFSVEDIKQLVSVETLEAASFFESLNIEKISIEGEQGFDIAPLRISRNKGQLSLSIVGQKIDDQYFDLSTTLSSEQLARDGFLTLPMVVHNKDFSLLSNLKLYQRESGDYAEFSGFIDQIQTTNLAQYLPSKIVGESTNKWMKRGFKSGLLENVNVHILKNISQDSAIEFDLTAHLNNTELVFNSDWQSLKNLNANININGDNIKVLVNKTSLYDFPLNNIALEITDMSQANLDVTLLGKIESTSEAFIRFLKAAPSGNTVHEVLEQFSLNGPLKGNLDLIIPLDDRESTLNVDLIIQNNHLTTLDGAVIIEDYDSEIAFRDNQITTKGAGNLRGMPFDIRINPNNRADDKEASFAVELVNNKSGFELYLTKRLDQTWRARIESESVKTNVEIGLSDDIPSVRIVGLQIATTDSLKGDWAIEPNDFPNMYLSTHGVFIDEQEIPDFSAKLESVSNVLKITNLQFEGVGVGDSDLLFDGAWVAGRTRLIAKAKGKGLSGFLEKMKINEKVSGGEFDFDVRLFCQCTPWNMSLKNMSGMANMNIKKGVFTDQDPNIGRLLSLLNIKSVAKRLKLDVNDLTDKGFAYDDINVQITLKNAIAKIDRFKLDATSSTIALSGQSDIIDQSYDLEAKVTPAIGDAVPAATYLAGGGLLGLGVWLVDEGLFDGKLIDKIVDKVVEFKYKITGPWDEPTIENISTIL